MKRAVAVTLLVIAIAVVSASALSQGRRTDKAIDPVCGLSVDKNPDLSVRHGNETYYFCSVRDMNAFRQNPEMYVRKR